MSPKATKGPKPELTSEELKSEILKIARKHFAKRGFSGASLKDIANEAGVAGSLLNYHWKDKLGLFKNCLEAFARDRMQMVTKILGEPRSPEEVRVRIELFVDEIINSMSADPYGFEIIEREIRCGTPEVVELFKGTMLLAFKAVVEFFKECKSKGMLREEADPMATAVLFFSAICDSVRKDHMAKTFFNMSLSQPEWRKRFSQTAVGLFMNGVMK